MVQKSSLNYFLRWDILCGGKFVCSEWKCRFWGGKSPIQSLNDFLEPETLKQKKGVGHLVYFKNQKKTRFHFMKYTFEQALFNGAFGSVRNYFFLSEQQKMVFAPEQQLKHKNPGKNVKVI